MNIDAPPINNEVVGQDKQFSAPWKRSLNQLYSAARSFLTGSLIAGPGIAITGNFPNQTITNTGAGSGSVTSVGGASPVVSSGGATPVISLKGITGFGTPGQVVRVAAAGNALEYGTTATSYTRGAAWDGSGAPINAGGTSNVPFTCAKAGTINSVTVLTQGGTGSCVVDVWKTPYGSYPPTVGNSITAAALPTITNGIKYQDTTLTGWTTAVNAGDTLMFHINSSSVFTYIEIVLELA